MTMELATASEMFERIYSGVLGYQISHGQRKRDNLEDRSLVYGEVLPDSFYKVMAQANPPPGGVFYDLGSGSGKALFLAAMLFDFSRLVGVEMLTDLVAACRDLPKPLSFTGRWSALKNSRRRFGNSIRSCGRLGPATEGTTESRSSSRVSV